VRCGQGASTALLAPSLSSFSFSAGIPSTAVPSGALPSDGVFHLRPHYRAARSLEATLLKTEAGSDEFITEKYHDQIAATLAEWSASWLGSPGEMQPIEKALAADFSGSSPLPVESRMVRAGSPVEVHKIKFSSESTLGRSLFTRELLSSMSGFSKLIIAEFQVTSIAADSISSPIIPDRLKTRIRYELVGTGSGSYREQRVGYWELDWVPSSSLEAGEFWIAQWRWLEETRSRSVAPAFLDITSAAFAENASYAAQMTRGTDYWRTVLDGACGIDIYGHNGVSAADIDNDGFDDLYICQPAGLPNRLYRNRGDGTFEDITEISGLGLLDNTACALFADLDNDGLQDVIVVRANGPLLFLNQGGGKFRQKPNAFRFASPPQGTFTGAAVADYDRDGWLDIYFCLYAYYQGTDQYKYPVPYYDAENGPPNFMMRNNRDGTFRDVTAEAGLNANNTRYSFCCGWNDYNKDGWPDLYVVNDFGRKNLYRNHGDGTFTDVAPQVGVEDVGAGMSVGWLDYDNDGAEDLYVADMSTAAGERVSMQDIFQQRAPQKLRALYQKHAMGNSLFHNADGTFEDRTSAAGVGMGRWSWSSEAFDFDHDGFPDLYIANGMVSGHSGQDLNSFFWRQVVARSPLKAEPSQDYEQGWSAINELIRSDGAWSGFERNVFYVNNRDGTFSDVSGAVGLDFVEDGRSFALADFDQDGRMEVLLKNRNAPQLRLLKNMIEELPPAIAFRLRGTKSNRDAIGATVTIQSKAGKQSRLLQAGSGFLAQHSKELLFGLGEEKTAVSASIRWPSGLAQELRELPLNHRIWVEEGSEKLRIEPFMQSVRGAVAVASAQGSESLPTGVETWLLTPIAAPDFSLPDLSGKVRSLSGLRGKNVLLNFWVASSKDCQDTLEVLERAHAKWVRGLQVISVNLDDRADAESIRALAREHRLTLPILLGSDDVSAVYNILYRSLFDRHRDLRLPTSLLIDENGEIVKLYQGSLNAERVEQDFRNIPRSDAERLRRALPFRGVSEDFEFGRNYLSLGSQFFQRGYFDHAAMAFERAVRENPASAEAYYGLGSAYLKQQKKVQARESFERASQSQASYPDTLANAWNNLGLIATEEADTAEAIRCFRESLKHNPNHLIALTNLGNAYRLQKSWSDARQTFERALELSPADADANYGLAMVYAQADDTAQAYEYLERALKSRPGYPEALNNLGILYLRTGRRDEAVASFEECVRAAPAFDQSYLNLARIYSLEGGVDKAQSVLLRLLKQHPNHAVAQSMLAQLAK
jgi:tetratricopeptide (TPR) repeat protein